MKRIRQERKYSDIELKNIENLAAECGLLFQTAQILYSRGMDTAEKVKRFVKPGKRHFINPYLLSGMKELAERIHAAKENDEQVVIYGDYDADGVCSSVILYKTLRELGINAEIFIPERTEGYGLSIENIESIAENIEVDLFITVDCGISSYKEIEYIKDLGIDIIVTDHHELPEILPDCIIVNPKLKGQDYPYDNLCGAGVALKAAYALIGDRADEFLDLAALATVADSVPLIDENRDIVCEGLKMLVPSKIRPALKFLLAGSKVKRIDTQTLSYGIAPKINAAGRMGSAIKAVELLLSEDIYQIEMLSNELESLNSERQVACEELKKQATAMLEKKAEDFNLITLYSKDWKGGLVGIVAAKLVEEYYCPAILFVNNDGILKGSARSLENINIYQALCSVKDLIIEFGGHAQAAGISIREQDFDEFERRLSIYLAENYSPSDYLPTTLISGFDFDASSQRQVKELMSLEPFGVQNKQPLFAHSASAMSVRRLKCDSPHLSINAGKIELMYFYGADKIDLLADGIPKTLAYEINVSTYKGKEYVKGFVRDIESGMPIADEQCLYTLRNNIKQLLNNAADSSAQKVEYISGDKIEKKLDSLSGFGTCLILSDIKNYHLFKKIHKLRTEIYAPIINNKSDFLLISPSSCDLSGYRQVIYLDKPISFSAVTDGKIFVNNNILGYNFIKDIDIDRKRLLDIYAYIKTGEKVKAADSAALFTNLQPPYTAAEFIFAAEVFLELNLITFVGENLYINKGVKSDLKSSKIYTIINILKDKS